MTRPYKKPKYQLDPKKFEPAVEKAKKEKDWTGSEIFDEIQRSKRFRR